MVESEGEIEDDPTSNWQYEESDAAGDDVADVLGEADAILNEDSQPSNQT